MIPVIGAAMVGSLFSSDAWNNVTFAAAEVQNPSRNLPLALALGTGLVSLLYILTNVAYLNVLPFYGDASGQRRARARAPARGAGPGRHRGDRGGARRRRRPRSWRSRSCSRPSAATTGSSSPGRGSTTRWRATTCSSIGPARCTRRTAPRSSGSWPRRSGPSVLCISGTYGQLLDYVIFAALVFYFLTDAGPVPAPPHCSPTCRGR